MSQQQHPDRRARPVTEQIRIVRELWLLREQARVQAAERCFLTELQRLLEARSEPSNVSPHADGAVFESAPRPSSSTATHPPTREAPRSATSDEVEALRARQFVTGLAPDFRALLEGTRADPPLARSRSFGHLSARRAVSGALESEFRHQLEALVGRRDRVWRRRPDPQYAPRRQHEHRDPRLYEDADDLMNDAHATGALNIPTGSTAMHASHERVLRDLQDEVHVMRNMLAACFDLQLDVQRAIRQEVSAAMSDRGVRASTSSSQMAETSACTEEVDVGRTARKTHSTAVSAGACTVCLERRVDSLLYGCGHMCTCSLCGRQLVAAGQACPICRAPVREVVRAFVVTG